MFARYFAIASLALAATAAQAAPTQQRYLAFQIFTASRGSSTLGQNFPPLVDTLSTQVDRIVSAIGTTGNDSRRLGFIVGPLAFDDTDERVRGLMREAFAIALQKNIATGFHIDDSMFWDRLASLNKPQNIEWLDWNKTPNTGRRLDWSSTPTKIMPQLCLNSPEVEAAVRRRATLIGQEAVRGIRMLRSHHHADLFVGLFAGWETQMGRDFETGKFSGYHALANEGYSAKNPPAEIDEARVAAVHKFVDLWATSLAQAGVPDDKIYSHTAFMSRASFNASPLGQSNGTSGSYLEQIDFTPPSTSFGLHHRPGFSTYPQFGGLEQIQAELKKNGNPPWASSEGTAVDPGAAEKGDPGTPMENYLGNLFGRGAVVVNVFGWGVGRADNPFRKVAENKSSIAVYRRWLLGEEFPPEPNAQIPSPQFFEKIKRLQKELPTYIAKHGPQKIAAFMEALDRDLKAQHFVDAEREVDQIFLAIKD